MANGSLIRSEFLDYLVIYYSTLGYRKFKLLSIFSRRENYNSLVNDPREFLTFKKRIHSRVDN